MGERGPGTLDAGSPRDVAVQLLKFLGLTGLEAELYLLLLEKGPMSAPEISDHLVKHRPQIHVALTRLSSKGYSRSWAAGLRSIGLLIHSCC